MNPVVADVAEQKRLNEAREAQIPWKKWGPYLSERRARRARDRALRRAGRLTAEQYSWSHVVRRVLLPRLHVVAEHLRFGKLRLA